MTEPTLVLRTRRLRAARGVMVARDVSLGDVVAVEGPNGAGKTTLPVDAALSGLSAPVRGINGNSGARIS